MVSYKERLKNPFLPLRADNLKDEEVIEFFANHTKCTPIANRGNQIVIGASGTGKTIAFRYFSLQNQLAAGKIDISNSPPFIGIYVPLGKESDIWKKKRPTEDIIRFYENFLNIEIVLEITKTMEYISEQNMWGVTSEKITNLLGSSMVLDGNSVDLIELHKKLREKKTSIINFIDRHKEPMVTEFHDTLNTSINTYIPQVCENIILNLDEFKNKTVFYLLLDQYDELSPWQQKIVNTLIRRPNDFYYVKLGCRPFGVYDETTISGRSMRDSLEGVVNLQYYRNEAVTFANVVLEITAKKLSCETLEINTKNLLPTESPLETARNIYLRDKQMSFFGSTEKDDIELDRILKKLSEMARDSETQRRLRSCIYQGFEKIVNLSEGNIGVYLNFLSEMWEHGRINGDISPDSRLEKLPTHCQIKTVWDFSNYKFSTIEAAIPEDGIYISNLVNRICESFEKGIFTNKTYMKTHDIEISPYNEISAEVINKLKKAFQYGVFIPISTAGYSNISRSFNLSRFYLPKWGLIDSKCPTFVLSSEELNEWFNKSPETEITQTRRGRKIKQIDEHLGFLSISFKKEEPASMARKRIQQLFDKITPKIKCFDIEKFDEPIGSRFLLTKIREGVHKDATFCLIEISNITSNVMIEFGLIKGLKKLFWVLVHKDRISIVPDWAGGLQLRPYLFDESDEYFLDQVIENKIIEQLKSISGKIGDFCPIQRGVNCPNPITKDRSKVFISYPQHDDIWNAVIPDLKKILFDKMSYRLISVEDIKSSIEVTSHKVCHWCYAIRSAGIVFVDTTPSQEDSKKKIANDPTQCFILGLAFGQKQKKRTHCVHIFKSGVGKEITLWEGYPHHEWNTKNDIIEAITSEVETRRLAR